MHQILSVLKVLNAAGKKELEQPSCYLKGAASSPNLLANVAFICFYISSYFFQKLDLPVIPGHARHAP